jgi:hypothetical protein
MYNATLLHLLQVKEAVATLNSYLTECAPMLLVVITMLVHPKTTTTDAHLPARVFLFRILEIKGSSVLNNALVFKGAAESSADRNDSHELKWKSLVHRAKSIWDVIEWSF